MVYIAIDIARVPIIKLAPRIFVECLSVLTLSKNLPFFSISRRENKQGARLERGTIP
jgi:hypothetical protein